MAHKRLIVVVLVLAFAANAWALSMLSGARLVGDVALMSKDDAVIGMVVSALALAALFAVIFYLVYPREKPPVQR